MFKVTCPDFTKDGFKTREAAEAWIARLTHCPHDHKIEETAR